MAYKLAEAFVELKSRGLDNVSTSLGGITSSLSEVVTGFGGLNRSIDVTSVALGGLAAAGVGALVAIGRKSIEVGSQLETAMAEVSTLVDTTVVDMEAMRSELVNMSTDVRKSSTELANGLYQVVSAGVDAKDATEVLTVAAKGAVAGMTDTFTAVDLVTTVLNTYQMSASDAERVSDLLFGTIAEGKTRYEELAGSLGRVLPIASELGVNLEELLGIIAHLTKGGLSTSESVTALRSAMMEFIKPSEKANDVLGDQVELMSSNAVRTKGLVQSFHDLRNTTEGNGFAISDLLGRQEAFLAITRTTGDELENLSTSIDKVTDSIGKTEEAHGKMTSTLAAQSNLLKLEVEKAWLDFYKVLKVPVSGAILTATKFVEGLNLTVALGTDIVKTYRSALNELWQTLGIVSDRADDAKNAVEDLSQGVTIPHPTPRQRAEPSLGEGVITPLGATPEELKKFQDMALRINIGGARSRQKIHEDALRDQTRAEEDAFQEARDIAEKRGAVVGQQNEIMFDSFRERQADEKKAREESLKAIKDAAEEESEWEIRLNEKTAKVIESTNKEIAESAEKYLRKEKELEQDIIDDSLRAYDELSRMTESFGNTVEDIMRKATIETKHWSDSLKDIPGTIGLIQDSLIALDIVFDDTTASALEFFESLAKGDKREIAVKGLQFTKDLVDNMSGTGFGGIDIDTSNIESSIDKLREKIKGLQADLEVAQGTRGMGQIAANIQKQIDEYEKAITILEQRLQIDKELAVKTVGNVKTMQELKDAPKRAMGGLQISQITGPTRDILVNLLSPLKNLNTTFPAMLDELRLQTSLMSGGLPQIPLHQATAEIGMGNGLVVEGDIVIQVSEESDLTANAINEQIHRNVLRDRRKRGVA